MKNMTNQDVRLALSKFAIEGGLGLPLGLIYKLSVFFELHGIQIIPLFVL